MLCQIGRLCQDWSTLSGEKRASLRSALAVVIVGPEQADFNRRRRPAHRTSAHAEAELDHARVFKMAAGGPQSTLEHALGDIDLMLSAIDASLGWHVAASSAYWMPRVQSTHEDRKNPTRVDRRGG